MTGAAEAEATAGIERGGKMSVLVKDMKMPERCLDCPIYDHYNYYCKLYSFGIPARYNRDGSIRPEWCELVELPEKHGRLIFENGEEYEIN